MEGEFSFFLFGEAREGKMKRESKGEEEERWEKGSEGVGTRGKGAKAKREDGERKAGRVETVKF